MEEEEVTNLVEKITITGKPSLDEDLLKPIKKACKHNDAYLLPVFKIIMKQLDRKHSEIRLSSFQLLVELFERSHKFRLLVLEELYAIFELTLETNDVILPPPKAAAKKLRTLSAETMHKWVKKFASAYRKLEHGYNYLRQVKRVCFNDIEGKSAVERQREEEQKLKMDNLWRERVKRVKTQIDESEEDLQDCFTQMNNCIDLLMPKPDNFLFGQDENEVTEKDDEDEDLAQHGFLDPKSKISIDLDMSSTETNEVKETEDNCEIFRNFREQYSIFTKKMSPMVKKWVVTLTKAGELCDPNLLKKSIDLKATIDEVESKCEPFEKTLKSKKFKRKSENADDDSDETDDEDFIEVEEKSGFEATVQAEDHLMGIDFYPAFNKPSTSKTNFVRKEVKVSKKKKEELDIEKLAEEQKVHKVPLNRNSEHFWSAGSRDDDAQAVEIADPSTTIFEMEETFEEVKWACLAPMPSGRLCPRKDRFKCPLHGKIIPRDNMGNPTRLEDKKLPHEENQAVNDDWQDPELLRDIEAATGVNLQVKKGKGKGKKSSESGLTNIREKMNTVRNRLEKKIFNRSSMKRVAADLNLSEAKKSRQRLN